MTILDELTSLKSWKNFYDYKIEKDQLTRKEQKYLSLFIEEERYLTIPDFGIVTKKVISKIDSAKKRTVYSFCEDETLYLKLLTFLLYRYDHIFSPDLYSFRKHISAKDAIDDLLMIPDLDEKYTLKLDIHDYFNSIDVDILMDILSEKITDDEPLLKLLRSILSDDRCIFNGQIIHEKKGAMAGVPVASFLANIYLSSLDESFYDQKIPYFRYSDDILVVCDSMDDVDRIYTTIKDHIEQKHLKLNDDKYTVTLPHQPFCLLGFKYFDGNIDLADITIEKMKKKIKRKAQRIYREGKKTGRSFDEMATKMIRSFDLKLYDLNGDNRYTWTRWFFPVISVSGGLKEIDGYMVEYLRFLYSGRHYKGNYKITYDHLKSLGYTSLVNEYYNWKNDNRLLSENK